MGVHEYDSRFRVDFRSIAFEEPGGVTRIVGINAADPPTAASSVSASDGSPTLGNRIRPSVELEERWTVAAKLASASAVVFPSGPACADKSPTTSTSPSMIGAGAM
jgi:hypothetical protein